MPLADPQQHSAVEDLMLSTQSALIGFLLESVWFEKKISEVEFIFPGIPTLFGYNIICI